MIQRDATDADIRHVCLNMRDESAGEAFASVDCGRERLASDLASVKDRLQLGALLDEMVPAALVGLVQICPGRASIMFLATGRFPNIAIAAHRWWTRHYVPGVLNGYRRVEFTGSLPGTRSGRWLVAVGFQCEGIARSYGRRGEDLAHWSWINPCWRVADLAGTVDGRGFPLACRRTERSQHV
jgi:hypothetical protein